MSRSILIVAHERVDVVALETGSVRQEISEIDMFCPHSVAEGHIEIRDEFTNWNVHHILTVIRKLFAKDFDYQSSCDSLEIHKSIFIKNIR